MQDLENRDFENKWKNAFADAEEEPTNALWVTIENRLAASEGIVMRSRVIFYQRLAAASVLVAIVFGGITLFNWNAKDKIVVNDARKATQNNKSAKQRLSEEQSVGKLKGAIKPNLNVDDKSEKFDKQIAENRSNEPTNGTHQRYTRTNLAIKKSTTNKDFNNSNGSSVDENKEQLVSEQFSPLGLVTETKNITTHSSQSVIGIEQLTLNNIFSLYEMKLTGKPDFGNRIIENFTPVIRTKKKFDDENWWAALGGSAGAYLPQGFNMNGGMAYSSVSSVPQKSTSSNAQVGTSFSFGMTSGKKIAKRWMIIAGVNYLVQSVDYSSNQSLNGSQAFLADFSTQKNNVTSFTTDYTVNSVNEFVSVPLLLGYQFVQRKIGWQLNVGVASDIFLRNSLVDPTGKRSTYTENAGDNSPYQTLNWTGIVGTELSYKISSHYRFALVPGVRYSFQSIVKPSQGQSINPIVGDVGFRFRYIF